MGMPVVKVVSGGLPVTIATTGGLPCTEATNGFGVAVTQSTSGGGLAVTGFTFGPTIQLSATGVLETAAVNTTIGTLSVSAGTTGTPAFTLVSGGSTFNILGTALRTSVLLDFETTAFYSITVAVSGVSPTVANQTFTIAVIDVVGPVAPVLALTSPTTDNTPDFTLTGDLAASDVIRFQYATNSSFTGATDITHTITAPEDAANSFSFSTGALANGTWYFRARTERPATDNSGWSNTVSETIATATYAGPGDVVSGWVEWHGLRAFSAAVAGVKPCCDILRASDSTVLTVYSLSNGQLDMAAVNTFLTATTGKVQKIYDQVGTMDVAGPAEEANFVASATPNGRPSAFDPDGNARLRYPAAGNLVADVAMPNSFSLIMKRTAAGTGNWYSAGHVINVPPTMNNTIGIDPYASSTTFFAATDNVFHDFNFTANGSNNWDVCIDGVDQHSTAFLAAASIAKTDTNPVVFGFGVIGHFLEGGLCATGMNSTQRAALAANQAAYYGYR